MPKLLVRFAFVLSILLSFHSTKAQTYNFRNYTIENGLPQSTVFGVLQDKRGYLWVGTESGAACFDGLNFKVYDKSDGLPDSKIRCITEDSKGNLWLGTEKGIAIYDGKKWSSITSKDGLKGSAILQIKEDNKGRFWVATNDSGLNIISLQGKKISIKNINTKNGLLANFIFDLHIDRNNKVWLAILGGGINTVTLDGDKVKIESINDKVFLPSIYISCIEEDRDGKLWFGSLDAGAFQLIKDKKSNKYTIPTFAANRDIKDPRIWDIHCDPNGDVWFATNENGVYQLSGNTVLNMSTRNGLPGNQILKIYRDNNRNLWFGTNNKGLVKFMGFEFVHYKKEDGLPGSFISAVNADYMGNIWIGSNEKGLVKANVKNNQLSTTSILNKYGFTSTSVNSIWFDNSQYPIVGTMEDGLAWYNGKMFDYFAQKYQISNVNSVFCGHDGTIYAGTSNGYSMITHNKVFDPINEDNGLVNNEVQVIRTDREGNIWLGTLGGLVVKHGAIHRSFDEKEGLTDLRVLSLVVDKHDDIIVGTSNGIYKYSKQDDTIKHIVFRQLDSRTINSLVFENDTTLIAGTPLGLNKIFFDKKIETPIKVLHYDKTNGFIFSECNQNAACRDKYNNYWFGTVNGLTRYRPALEDSIIETPVIHLTGIRLEYEKVNWKNYGDVSDGWFEIPKVLDLPYYKNHITFDYTGIYLKNAENVRYRYKLEGQDKVWSPINSSTSVTYPALNDGHYTFTIIASADGVNWSKPVTYSFVIEPPFWKRWWFYISVSAVLIVLMVVYVRWREKKLIKEKEHLECIVRERTAEVVRQKDEIALQHKIVMHQKQEITDSINYAQRIQRAVLPGVSIFEENTQDHFILFKPRDIVSGDFYWMGKQDNKLIVAAADCTGHGVPGAFMSMLGVSFLNKIINEQKVIEPGKILNHLRENIIESLQQKEGVDGSKDGMDITICVVDLDTLELMFAGANNPIVRVSNGEAEEIKGDKMPVGIFLIMNDFETFRYQLQKGDCIYMFSDGYQDQMGGPNCKKFMRKNMRELLFSIHQKPFDEQRDILDTTTVEWRLRTGHPDGEVDQMDDIMVIGFKV